MSEASQPDQKVELKAESNRRTIQLLKKLQSDEIAVLKRIESSKADIRQSDERLSFIRELIQLAKADLDPKASHD